MPQLRRSLFGTHGDSALLEIKMQDPGAGDGLTANFGRLEGPLARGLERFVGEVFAGPGGIEIGVRHIAGRIHGNPDRNLHST